MSEKVATKKIKRKLESLLTRHDYTRDDRPDHREWMKSFDNYFVEIRLDQNNPEGFNGFFFHLTTHLRRGISEKQVTTLISFLNSWYETRRTKKTAK